MGGSDFGACENFAYRVRDFFFVRGGYAIFVFSRTRYAKNKIRVPLKLGGSIFNFFQKLGLRDSAYPLRLFRNVEYSLMQRAIVGLE